MALNFTQPDVLGETPAQKYESCMDELVDFGQEWWGSFDQRALRIVLSVAYLHEFSTDRVPWLWVNNPPAKLDQALGHGLGKIIHAPHAGTFARELKDQKAGLWVLSNEHSIFHRTPAEIEFCLNQLAETEAGDYEWLSRGAAVDGRLGPDGSFAWSGRLTVIATSGALSKLETARCNTLWEIVQNSFVNVRFDRMTEVARPRWEDQHEFVVARLKRMVLNLLDRDFRERRESLRADSTISVQTLTRLVAAIRGSGFDVELLQKKALRISGAHAAMMGKDSVDAEDISLTRKILLDAIPARAIKTLRAIPADGSWTRPQLTRQCKLPAAFVSSVVDRLVDSGLLVRPSYSNKKDWVHVSPELQEQVESGL